MVRLASPRMTLLAAAAAPPPTVERICGWPSEVVRVGSSNAAIRLVFVPGNPGIASFYGSAAAALAEDLDASAAVIGFRGHTLAPLLRPTQAFGLEEQVEHVAGFLEAELTASGEQEMVVVGHSIGAWVAFEAVRRLAPPQQRRCTALVGLMPYLSSQTPDALDKAALVQRWFAPILMWVLACAAQLIGWLPVAAWRRSAIKLIEPEVAGYEEEQKEIAVRSLPRFGTLFNILTLFRAEARHHAAPYDYPALAAAFPGRLALLYAADGDIWAPKACAEAAAAAGIMVHEQSGVPHAFGTQTATRQTVVSWVTGTVRKLRGGGGGGKAPGAARARRSPKRKGAAGVL